MIYIKYLPKYKLLYDLWAGAKVATNFNYCRDAVPTFTIEEAEEDIKYILEDKAMLTVYYGRLLYVDITGDYVNPIMYDLFNGDGKMEDIIIKLKIAELKKTILRYYTFQ